MSTSKDRSDAEMDEAGAPGDHQYTEEFLHTPDIVHRRDRRQAHILNLPVIMHGVAEMDEPYVIRSPLLNTQELSPFRVSEGNLPPITGGTQPSAPIMEGVAARVGSWSELAKRTQTVARSRGITGPRIGLAAAAITGLELVFSEYGDEIEDLVRIFLEKGGEWTQEQFDRWIRELKGWKIDRDASGNIGSPEWLGIGTSFDEPISDFGTGSLQDIQDRSSGGRPAAKQQPAKKGRAKRSGSGHSGLQPCVPEDQFRKRFSPRKNESGREFKARVADLVVAGRRSKRIC